MFDGKFIATLFAIAVSIFAICNFNTKKITSHEGFGLNNLTYRKEQVCANSQEEFDRGNFSSDCTEKCNKRYESHERYENKGNGYSTVPNFQANISPRFSNVNHGAHIRYNTPSEEYLASSCDPLTFGGMAREDFTTGSKESFHSGKLMEGNYAAGNYNEISGQSDEYIEASSMVPIGDMTTLNALGNTDHTVCYDRYIYSNRKNRKNGGGCLIRGDLAIAPCKGNWFSVSADTAQLEQGALAVIGGKYNGSAVALADLINTNSGKTTISGIDMSTSKNMYTGHDMSTVQVTSFA